MLTKTDLDNMKGLIDERLDVMLDTKLDEKLNEKLKFFPTKDDFFTKMDELLSEVKAMREEQEAHSGQHSDINDELENHSIKINKLAKQLGISL